MIGISVYGVPAPQGSKRGFVRGGKVQMVESSSKVKPWREAMKYAALTAMEGLPPLTGPLEVDVVFYVPRPKSTRRGARPFNRPDLDKYLRTLDALTDAGVWLDDAQVVKVTAEKVYADPEADVPVLPGASIAVTQVQP